MLDNNGMLPETHGRLAERPVLIVEDSENSAAMLEIALSSIPGVTLLMAALAVDAWRILSGGTAIQAVVTDLNMLRMGGFELIRPMRQDHRFAATPIVVVSADTDPGTPERIAELCISAFFAKPFSPAEVRRKLRSEERR